MKKKIRIDFSDFWGGFEKTDNYFYNYLKEEFDIEISSNPDFLFFSVFGQNHLNYNCTKIAYYAENIPAPLGYCQWAFSNDYLDDPRNYRLPHYLLYDGYYDLALEKKIDESLPRRKFCSFVVSNGNCAERNQFFNQLSKYKKVDSGGRWMNNIGYAVPDKRKFQSEYKFSITFENNAYRSQWVGYSTEKLPEAMMVNSLPIYWGNPGINLEFNTKSFINFYDHNSFESMIERIIELDKNDDKYMEVMKETWLVDSKIPEANKEENVKSFLFKIFE